MEKGENVIYEKKRLLLEYIWRLEYRDKFCIYIWKEKNPGWVVYDDVILILEFN